MNFRREKLLKTAISASLQAGKEILHALLYDFKDNYFFNGKQLRVDMSPLGGTQTESLVFGENDSIYITTEETNQPHSLFKVEWEKWKQLMR